MARKNHLFFVTAFCNPVVNEKGNEQTPGKVYQDSKETWAPDFATAAGLAQAEILRSDETISTVSDICVSVTDANGKALVNAPTTNSDRY
jgi:hypothetical protein